MKLEVKAPSNELCVSLIYGYGFCQQVGLTDRSIYTKPTSPRMRLNFHKTIMQQKRKQTLQYGIDVLYASHRQGRLATRRERIRIMHGILNDLSSICRLPSQWSSFHTNHIDHLVAHWCQRKLRPATVIKRLAILRHFHQQLQLPWDIPPNRHYALQVPSHHSNVPTFEFHEVYQRLAHPAVKIIFGFECLFGLTRQEIFRLRPALHGATGNNIYLTRDIALHGRERYVPILTNDQQQLWQERSTLLTDKHKTLTEQWPECLLRSLYRAMLHEAGLNSQIRYRFYYLRFRQQQLVQQSFKQQLQILHQETGLSFSHIRYYLHEQTKVK